MSTHKSIEMTILLSPETETRQIELPTVNHPARMRIDKKIGTFIRYSSINMNTITFHVLMSFGTKK